MRNKFEDYSFVQRTLTPMTKNANKTQKSQSKEDTIFKATVSPIVPSSHNHSSVNQSAFHNRPSYEMPSKHKFKQDKP